MIEKEHLETARLLYRPSKEVEGLVVRIVELLEKRNVNGVRSFFGVIEELEVTFAAEWYTGNSAFKSGFVFEKIIPLVEFLHHVVADVHAHLSCGSSNEIVFVVYDHFVVGD